ncbi:MAG: hypothetical protein CMJ59_25860 [Planctomycetaceae bacterium]|nr:hypothetical protein [Planctomycetaceae bacterium]
MAAVEVAGASPLEVGAAVRRFTPDPLLPISGGMGPESPVSQKRGELMARAVVFRGGGTLLAVVSIDALGFPAVLCQRVREQVPRIPSDHILIGATHTHSAPDCYAFPDGRGGHTGNLDYIQQVCRRAAEAVNAAFDALRPAWLRVATGEARGKIAYNYYAPDLYDRRMSLIQAVTPAGKTVVTLVNYAIHPEVLGSGAGILSPDLVGPLCERLQQRLGGVAIFINGAQGGMVTADNRDLERPRDATKAYWHDRRTWQECVRIGHAMASEAERILVDAPLEKTPKLFCGSRNVTFPVESDPIWNVIQHSPLGYSHNADRSVTSRLNLINLGTAQILTIPGEALPNIGFYLKRKMRGTHNLLFGLTNDAFGYILTKVDYGSFPRYDYITRTSLGEMTGEILIRESLDLVARSPRSDPPP